MSVVYAITFLYAVCVYSTVNDIISLIQKEDDKMKLIERQFARYEKRCCAKHGRSTFLNRTINTYGLTIVIVVLDFILAAGYSFNGIAALAKDAEYIRFPNYIWYFSLAALWLLQAIIWATRLPFYKRKASECKEELKKNYAQSLTGDLTIRDLTDEMKGIKCAVENLLFKHGFKSVTVKLLQNTVSGQEEMICYNLGELYCNIGFMKNATTTGEIKNWVMLEYADSFQSAAACAFEDGDSIPLDIPVEQIIVELEQELVKNIG